MKDIKIQEQTHKKLSILKAKLGVKNFDTVIQFLLDIHNDTIISDGEQHDKE